MLRLEGLQYSNTIQGRTKVYSDDNDFYDNDEEYDDFYDNDEKYDDLYEDEYGEDELEEIELPSNEFIPEEQDEFLADIQEESAESLVDWYNKYIKTGGK